MSDFSYLVVDSRKFPTYSSSINNAMDAMTNLSTDWEKSYWRRHETEAEHAERVEAAELDARWYHERVVKAPTELYYEKLRLLAPYRGPFFERKRAQALRDWREATKPAAILFDKHCCEVMEFGEVSQATAYEWEVLEVGAAMSEAAE